MELMERLRKLNKSGRLSEKNYAYVLRVLRYFRDKQGIILTDRNSGMLIMHLCDALKRINDGEDILPFDRSVYEETTSEPDFERAVSICRDLCRILPEMPSSEVEYLIMHVGVLLSNLQRDEEFPGYKRQCVKMLV